MSSGYAAAVAGVVRGAIQEAGLNESKLADLTGIPRVTLRRRLQGQVPFDAEQLGRVASALGTRASDILFAAERVA